MSNHKSNSAHFDDEISLIDILLFLKQAWKMIAGAVTFGVALALIFLLVTPNQYDATANIQMARIALSIDKNPLGVNVEEPQALINRMSVPTSMDEAAMQACQLPQSNMAPAQLAKVIKLTIPKGVANTVELKVTSNSPELASACAQSIVDLIVKTQADMVNKITEPALSKNKTRLSKVQERLVQDEALLTKAEQPKNAVSPAYFALLREIRALEDERESLAQMLKSNQGQAAQLQAPILASSQPVFPKKAIALAAGLVGGLFLGLLIALGKKIVATLKVEMRGWHDDGSRTNGCS